MDGWTRNTTSTLIVEIKPSRVATQRLADERPLYDLRLDRPVDGTGQTDGRTEQYGIPQESHSEIPIHRPL